MVDLRAGPLPGVVAEDKPRWLGSIGKIDDVLRGPGLCLLQRLDRGISRLPG